MSFRTCETWLWNAWKARGISSAAFSGKLTGQRILVTADLDGPQVDHHMQSLLDFVTDQNLPLTLFCTSAVVNERGGLVALQQMLNSAARETVPLEIASHSIKHEPLPGKDPAQAAFIMEQSVQIFREKGIPVVGFRSPYLSIEGDYRTILKELGRTRSSLRYDSSTLFEGTLLASRIHDLFPWKSPHRVSGIWELPISCLDDWHLFVKLVQRPEDVRRYWQRKADLSLGRFNYFLFLLHPQVIGAHLPVLGNLIDHCRKAHPAARFVTCSQLVEELDTAS